ncbi:MAG: hypothetical protein CTY28_14565 [Hyphomicrobium sp.]|nr:MAG: hypothetical protein CTY28_14565 [Hyphomicrobium sp.]
MFTATTPSAHAPPLPARAAVETVRVGSAGLSASYYAMLGLTVHPLAAVGLGLIAGAADYIKSNALGTVIDGPGVMRRLIAVPLFLVLFVASMIAVDGVLLKLRDALVSGPANTISDHDRATAAHKAAVDEIARLGTVRTPDAIRADMDAAPVSRTVFRRTNDCTDITKEESFTACKPILNLRQEMASAIRKRELEAARDKAAARIETLGPRPSSADPQAEAVANAAGVSVSTAAWILIAIVGFAIELAACFGMYVLSAPARRNTVAAGAPTKNDTAQASLVIEKWDAPAPTPPTGGGKTRKAKLKPAPASNVLAFPHPVVSALQSAGGTVASNQQLATLMGVTEGEASKRVEEVRHLLDLRREGKRIVISLRGAA